MTALAPGANTAPFPTPVAQACCHAVPVHIRTARLWARGAVPLSPPPGWSGLSHGCFHPPARLRGPHGSGLPGRQPARTPAGGGPRGRLRLPRLPRCHQCPQLCGAQLRRQGHCDRPGLRPRAGPQGAAGAQHLCPQRLGRCLAQRGGPGRRHGRGRPHHGRSRPDAVHGTHASADAAAPIRAGLGHPCRCHQLLP